MTDLIEEKGEKTKVLAIYFARIQGQSESPVVVGEGEGWLGEAAILLVAAGQLENQLKKAFPLRHCMRH